MNRIKHFLIPITVVGVLSIGSVCMLWSGYEVHNIPKYDFKGSLPPVFKPVEQRPAPYLSYDWLYGKEYEAALDRAAEAKKRIVFWYPSDDKSMTNQRTLERDCGSCDVRNDKSLIDKEGTHAVIFLCEDTTRDRLPAKRNLKQYWVWRTAEAIPYLNIGGWVQYTDKINFNLTLNYRRDADITLHYGSTYGLFGKPLPSDHMKKKTEMALVAVSNCGSTPGAKIRVPYIKTLIKNGLELKTMGRCFSENQIPKNSAEKMLQETSRYKFYLAFENAYHCKDYITEKFFRPLLADTVPVVWGARRADYEEYVPGNAFIHVEDFDSMPSLIQYLYYLDKNDTAYLEYFKWRSYPKPGSYRKKEALCQLCLFLNGINVDEAYKIPYDQLSKDETFITDGPKERRVKSLNDWYTGTEDPECLANKLVLDEKGKIVPQY